MVVPYPRNPAINPFTRSGCSTAARCAAGLTTECLAPRDPRRDQFLIRDRGSDILSPDTTSVGA